MRLLPRIETIVDFNEWIPLGHKRYVKPILWNDIVLKNEFDVDGVID